MKPWILLIAFLLPFAVRAEDLSPTAQATDAPKAITAAARTRALSMDPVSWGFGGGYYTTGWTLEDAYWEHFSVVSRLDMNVGGTGGVDTNRDGVAFHTMFKARLGSRWRPWDKKSLAGPFLGLGLSKYLSSYNHYDTGTSTGTWFWLDQELDVYAELGWQWVLASGLLAGIKLTVPIYADWWQGTGSVAERFTTLSATWGFAW